MLTAYIQKVRLNETDPPEFTLDITFNAFQGFDKEGTKIVFFEEADAVPRWNPNHMRIMVADIDTTIQYFKDNGMEEPRPLDIPDELMEFTDRKINITTLGEFKKDTTLPIFVKPHSKIKAFSSGVIKKQISRSELFIRNDKGEILDDTMEVLTSEVVEMLSEYRCFVHKGKLVDMKHYQGDFMIFPNVNTIKKMIAAYTTAPAAYSLDVAVIKNSDSETRPSMHIGHKPKYKTILVEAQDMWSIGPYGLDAKIYVSLLKVRWFEIFNKKR